jgi:hypothetical protein
VSKSFGRRRNINAESWQFGTYLMVTAVMAAFSYAVLGCHVRDVSLIRYTLLTLYFPIGLLVVFLSAKPGVWSRAAVLSIVAVWAAGLDAGQRAISCRIPASCSELTRARAGHVS